MTPEAPHSDDRFATGCVVAIFLSMIAMFAVWALWMLLR